MFVKHCGLEDRQRSAAYVQTLHKHTLHTVQSLKSHTGRHIMRQAPARVTRRRGAPETAHSSDADADNRGRQTSGDSRQGSNSWHENRGRVLKPSSFLISGSKNYHFVKNTNFVILKNDLPLVPTNTSKTPCLAMNERARKR